jgi:tetratricopeptide (TPR) repeat protein
MNRILLICTLVVLFLPAALRAQETTAITNGEPLTLCTRAAALYQKNKYEQAVTLYESLVATGQTNAALWYNLGNSYYRTQKPGMALVCFERARRIAPRDSDIRHNQSFIRQLAGEPEEQFSAYLLSLATEWISLNETAMAATAMLFIAAIAGTLWLYRRIRILLPIAVLATVAILLLGGLLAYKVHDEVFLAHAVITTGPAEVRNGPDLNESVSFSLPEGRHITVLSENGDWAAIGVAAEGWRGWLLKKNIQRI